jgi:hypothetical protein
MAQLTFAASLAAGAIVGPAAGAILDEVFHLPGPAWAQLSDHASDAISVSVGIGVALMSLPVARAITRRLYRRLEARVNQLADAIAAKVRESIQ